MRETTYQWGHSQNKTISGTAASATLTDTFCRVVRLFTDTLCYVSVIGTATASSTPVAAGFPEYIKVPAGANVISVIGTSGTLNITECSQ